MSKTVDALLKLGVEGADEFQNTLKRETQEVSRLKDEYKVLATGLSTADKSANRYQKQTESLTKVLQAQRAKQQEIQNIMDKLADSTNDADKETDEYKDTMDALQKQLNKATIEANKTERDIEKLGKEMDDADKETREAAMSMEDLKAAMTGAAAVGNLVASAIKAIAKTTFEIAKGAVQYNMQMERSEKIMESFIGAADTQEVVKRMKALTKQTGFATTTLLGQTQALIGAGKTGEEASEDMDALAKALAAVGGSDSDLETLTQNMGEMAAGSQAMTKDIRQFTSRGIPMFSLLADYLGISVEKTQELVSKGKIGYDDITGALKKATGEGGQYFNALEAGMGTLEGKTNTLKTLIQDGLGTAFEPVNAALSEKLLPLVTGIVENIDWEAVGTVVAGMVGDVTEIIEQLQSFDWAALESYFKPLTDAINAALEALKQAIGYIAEHYSSQEGERFTTEFATGMHRGNTLVANFAADLHEKITGEVNAAADDAGAAGERTSNNYAGGISEGKEDAKKAAEEVELSAFGAWNQNNQSEKAGGKFTEDFAAGIHRNNTVVSNAAYQIWTSAQNEVSKASEARQYGADFTLGFASGITSNQGAVLNAANAVMGVLRSIVHFSAPDKGPMKDWEDWPEDFVKGYAQGITDNIWRIQEASREMAQALANPVFNQTRNEDRRTINMTVNGAPGQDAEELADYVIYRLGVDTDRRMRN